MYWRTQQQYQSVKSPHCLRCLILYNRLVVWVSREGPCVVHLTRAHVCSGFLDSIDPSLRLLAIYLLRKLGRVFPTFWTVSIGFPWLTFVRVVAGVQLCACVLAGPLGFSRAVGRGVPHLASVSHLKLPCTALSQGEDLPGCSWLLSFYHE